MAYTGALKTCHFFEEKSSLKSLVNPMYFEIYSKIEVFSMDKNGRKIENFQNLNFWPYFQLNSI